MRGIGVVDLQKEGIAFLAAPWPAEAFTGRRTMPQRWVALLYSSTTRSMRFSRMDTLSFL